MAMPLFDMKPMTRWRVDKKQMTNNVQVSFLVGNPANGSSTE